MGLMSDKFRRDFEEFPYVPPTKEQIEEGIHAGKVERYNKRLEKIATLCVRGHVPNDVKPGAFIKTKEDLIDEIGSILVEFKLMH